MSTTEKLNTNSLDELYKNLYEQTGIWVSNQRYWLKILNNFTESSRLQDKQSRQKKKRPQVPLKPAKNLKSFECEHGQMMTKAAVMKHISSYIKEKNLQVKKTSVNLSPTRNFQRFSQSKSQRI